MNELQQLLKLLEDMQTTDYGGAYWTNKAHELIKFDLVNLRCQLAKHAGEIRSWARDCESLPEFSEAVELRAAADYFDQPDGR